MRVLKEDRGARHCANLQRLIPQTAVGFRKTNIWSLEIEKSFILMRLANNPNTGFCLCVCVCVAGLTVATFSCYGFIHQAVCDRQLVPKQNIIINDLPYFKVDISKFLNAKSQ